MAIKYATATGSSANSGDSEAQAWTLDFALTQLANGMTLYVKAGTYTNISRVVTIGGATSGSHPKIIGYKNTPNDIVATKGTTLYTGGMPDANEAPLIQNPYDGNNRPTIEFGLNFNVDWIEISNLSFHGYSQPFRVTGDNTVVDNVYTWKHGTHNPADLGGFGTTFPTGPYTGWGIIIAGDNHQLKNSYVLDAGAVGINVLNSNNFIHRDNKVETKLGVGSYYWQPELSDGNSTDYHYLIDGISSGGRLYDIAVEQKTGMGTDGHGIVFKNRSKIGSETPIDDMIVDGFTVFNSKIEVQFPNTTNITFRNGVIDTDDTGAYTAGKDANLANGGKNITLENIQFKRAAHLTIRGWQDTYDLVYPYSVENLKVLNCSFEGVGVESAIWITHGPGNNDTHRAKDVFFDHCTFSGYFRFAYMSSDFENVNFTNCIVVDQPTYYQIGYMDGAGPAGGTGGPYPLFADWDNNNFFNSFIPNGGSDTNTNSTALDPALDANGVTTNPTLLTAGIATADYAAGLPIGYLGEISTPPILDNLLAKKQNAIILINN